MKKQCQKIYSKVSQAGSLMIEAMAMLALISLVTPTLYKKSAERTTELQDINTATHIRTMMKAVDNYVSSNYEELSDSLTDGQVKVIDLANAGADEGIHDYFPYGYQFEELRNFGTPKVALQKQGGSITSFVQLPKKTDIGEMRAARIASMVGSNGGYVNADKEAQGVGGIWSLNETQLGDLSFDSAKGSIVVASSDAINSASSGALENEKYLQRTAVESHDQLWRNTMVTDLYMGGVTGVSDMYKILGVDQMIVGSTEDRLNQEDLVLSADAGDGGSAWLGGNFSALSEAFTLTDIDNPILNFVHDGTTILNADSNSAKVLDDGANIGLSLSKTETSGTMETDYATTVHNDLTAEGNTHVASSENTTFKAGPDGSYISADANNVQLLDNLVEVKKGGEGTSSTTDIKTAQVNITGNTKIGTGDIEPKHVGLDPKLNVQGNAFVSGILEAGEIETEKFDALELHAGGSSLADDKRWLHATKDGVNVTDMENGEIRLQIEKDGDTGLYHRWVDGYVTAVVLGDTNAQLRGGKDVHFYTVDKDGLASIQGGAIEAAGRRDLGEDNTVNIAAATTTVSDGIFQVNGAVDSDGNAADKILYVNPHSSNVEVTAQDTTVNLEGSDGFFQVVKKDGGQELVRVNSKINETTPSAVAEIDEDKFRVSSFKGGTDPQVILKVDTSTINPKEGDEMSDNASVYIRRGAIEVEAPDAGAGYAADAGVGYIEANRFVSNAFTLGTDGKTPLKPVYVGDYSDSIYDTKEHYDRYMVNPAYTSVMHDIKLTTRGGARLSDILPDFINKGIYVVNNTFKENGNDINTLRGTFDGQHVGTTGTKPWEETNSDDWVSPYLGVIPAPLCPPGHARVVTITPAGFQMSQAGAFQRTSVPGADRALYVNEYAGYNELANINNFDSLGPNATITGAQLQIQGSKNADGTDGPTLYYLGYGDTGPQLKKDNGVGGETAYAPQPLYFQQSTWLKSKVIPQAVDHPGPCSGKDKNGKPFNVCGENFIGWSAIMGFVYPGSYYKGVIEFVNPSGGPVKTDELYWNIFPVKARTLEAYATVYCYFDRTNLYKTESSSVDPSYIDQYDQLNKFRQGHGKGVSSDYLNRLNDPALKYNEPW